MPKTSDRKKTDLALIQLLPNILTIVAICAGLTAIRFGVQGSYVHAVQLIVVAAILDGVDGRLARLLGSDSKMGAELDSLADFLNFGVAPALVVYYWTLQDTRSIGWLSVLVFAVCCVVRLARFNVDSKSDDNDHDSAYFTGVPAPAGALLVMLPMYLAFAFPDFVVIPDILVSLYMVLIGYLLISRIPTWSFKTIRISRENIKFFLVVVAFVGAAVLTFAWISLMLLCLAYIAVVVWQLFDKTPYGGKGKS